MPKQNNAMGRKMTTMGVVLAVQMLKTGRVGMTELFFHLETETQQSTEASLGGVSE